MARTHHGIRGILLSEPSNIAAVDTQDQREVRRVCKAKTISRKARPDIGCIDLANHDRSREGDGKVQSNEVGASVLEVGAAERADKDEHSLVSDADHLHE